VAIVSADAEFAKTVADAARDNAKAAGFTVVYEQSYPPATTDFLPVMRAVQAANPDVMFRPTPSASSAPQMRSISARRCLAAR